MNKIKQQSIINHLKKQFLSDTVAISMVLLIVGTVIIFVLFKLSPAMRDNYFQGLFVEFSGMIFDIFIFGILISLYARITSKYKEIEHQLQIIDDYKKWDSTEGKLRISGAIRRVIKLGKTNFDFSGILLSNYSFLEADIKNISGSNFFPIMNDNFISNLQISKILTKLNNVSFQFMDCSGVTFSDSNNGTSFSNLHFAKANLTEAKFDGVHLIFDRTFSSMNAGEIVHSQFEGANLKNASFKSATFEYCDFRHAKNLATANFYKAKGLETCLFDPSVDVESLNKIDLQISDSDQNTKKKKSFKTLFKHWKLVTVCILLALLILSSLALINEAAIIPLVGMFTFLVGVIFFFVFSVMLYLVLTKLFQPKTFTKMNQSVDSYINKLEVDRDTSSSVFGSSMDYLSMFLFSVIPILLISKSEIYLDTIALLMLAMAGVLFIFLLSSKLYKLSVLQSSVILLLVVSVSSTWFYTPYLWVFPAGIWAVGFVLIPLRIKAFLVVNSKGELPKDGLWHMIQLINKQANILHNKLYPKGSDVDSVAITIAILLIWFVVYDIFKSALPESLLLLIQEFPVKTFFSYDYIAYLSLYFYALISVGNFQEAFIRLTESKPNDGWLKYIYKFFHLIFVVIISNVFASTVVFVVFLVGYLLIGPHLALAIGFFTFPVWITKFYAFIVSTFLHVIPNKE